MALKTRVVTRRVVDAQALYRDIGRRMKDARTRAKLSQDAVGVAIGMTRANVANLESGKTRILLEHVYNVALLVGRPVRELLP